MFYAGSNHYGIAGYYALMAVKQGLIVSLNHDREGDPFMYSTKYRFDVKDIDNYYCILLCAVPFTNDFDLLTSRNFTSL